MKQAILVGVGSILIGIGLVFAAAIYGYKPVESMMPGWMFHEAAIRSGPDVSPDRRAGPIIDAFAAVPIAAGILVIRAGIGRRR